jgi:hypothetical protein
LPWRRPCTPALRALRPEALTPPRSLTTTPNNMRLDSLSCLRLGRQDRIGAETCQKRARSEPHGLTGAPCGAGMQSGSASRVLELDLGFHHRRNARAVSAAFNTLRQAPACVDNWFFTSLAVAITLRDINVRGRVEIGRSAVACFSLRKTEGASGARKSGGHCAALNRRCLVTAAKEKRKKAVAMSPATADQTSARASQR